MFGRRRTPSAPPYLLMFRLDRPIAGIRSSLVLYRLPCSVSLALWRRHYRCISGEYGGCSRISHYQRRKTSVTAAAVWLIALSWRMMGFCTTKCRSFLLSAGRRWYCRNLQLQKRVVVGSVYRLPWRYSVMQYYRINVIRHNEHHLYSALCWAHFTWTRRTGMLSSFDWRFKFGSYGRAQDSSIATIRPRK